jgi:RNA polymerase sigma factor (sigma-70 family)
MMHAVALDMPAITRSASMPGYSSPAMTPTAESATRSAELTYDDLLLRVRARLVSAARRRWGSDAEDLAHDTLVVLTTKYAHVRRIEEMVPLAVAILRRKGASRWRTIARRGDADAPDLPAELASTDATPEELAERAELVRRLTEAVGHLRGRCREILRLQLLGYRSEEMRLELGARSVGTVDSWKSRCYARLRGLLADRGEV